MDQIWEILRGANGAGGISSPENVILSLLVAFILGMIMAWVYYFTHSGLSYSKTYVQSLVLITIIVAMIMAIIGDSLTRAFGLMGALAIIRFRNVVKDTRDMIFIFCSLVIGMASGTQNYGTAVIGTCFLSLVAIYLFLTNFGSHQAHNGFLRFTLPGHIGPNHPVSRILKRFTRSFTLISVQDDGTSGSNVEYAYQLMIRSVKKNEQLITELESLEGIEHISPTLQEQLLEV